MGFLLLLYYIRTGIFFKRILLATGLIKEYSWLKFAKCLPLQQYKYGLLSCLLQYKIYAEPSYYRQNVQRLRKKKFFYKKVQLQGLLNDLLDGSAENLVVWLKVEFLMRH